MAEILPTGARQMPQAAIEREVSGYIEGHSHIVDDAGRRLVVRNGHLSEREIATGIGSVNVSQSRVRDTRPLERREVFTPAVLPEYLR